MSETEEPSHPPTLGLIVARSSIDGAIGRHNALPWTISEDLKHFKRETLGRSVIVGRKTFESIGRPLPKRRNIVVSQTLEIAPTGTELAPDIETALAMVAADDEMPFVIGGSKLYTAMLPFVTHVVMTEVDSAVPEADAFFSLPDDEFELTRKLDAETPGVSFMWLRRRLSAPDASR